MKELADMMWIEAKSLKYKRMEWLNAVANKKKTEKENKKNILSKVAAAAKSVIKTTILRKERTTDEQYKERLDICNSCEHAVHKNGNLYTCGPMFKSLVDANQKTCGCVLTKKARDVKQECPYGYWPTIKQT